MDHRSVARHRRRLTLRYSKDGAVWHPAFSHDLSAWGLFVTTRQHVHVDTELVLEVDLPQRGCVTLRARVLWNRAVPPSLHSVRHGGFGVHIEQAPELWYQYVAELSHPPSNRAPTNRAGVQTSDAARAGMPQSPGRID